MFMPFNLKGAIGANYIAEQEDLIPIKKTLNKVGYYKKPSWDYSDSVDQPLINAITAFQQDNNLEPDGVMKPGGPTEKKLIQVAEKLEDEGQPKDKKASTILDHQKKDNFDGQSICDRMAQNYNHFDALVKERRIRVGGLEDEIKQLQKKIGDIKSGALAKKAFSDAVGWLMRRRLKKKRAPKPEPKAGAPGSERMFLQQLEAELKNTEDELIEAKRLLRNAEEELAKALEGGKKEGCKFGWSSDGIFSH